MPDSSKRDSLSPNVRGALEALYEELKQLHITFGHATRDLCFCWHHLGEINADENYIASFEDWCDLHPAIDKRFRDLVTQNTPSAEFRAFFEFYLEMVAALAVRRIDADTKRWIEREDGDFKIKIPARPTIFARLVEIGFTHEADGIAWAKACDGVLPVER